MIGFNNVIKLYKNIYNPYFFNEGDFLRKVLEIVVKMN